MDRDDFTLVVPLRMSGLGQYHRLFNALGLL